MCYSFNVNNISELNPQQLKAVMHKDGPLLVVAGAGAGKTKVITHRILQLIKSGVAPHEILAVTFTNKAAKEMRERVLKLIAEDTELNLPISQHALNASLPFVSTFHSLGVHIIKEHGRLLGIPRGFTIFDRSDSLRAIKEGMKAVDVDPKQFEPRKVLNAISRQKGDGLSTEQYASEAGNDYFKRTVASVWMEYEKILAKEKSLDFDDLLLKAVVLLKGYPDVLKHYQSVWKYLLIDEYQDTNEIQFAISQLLAGDTRNICVVGDIDQNIYSWRGAQIENLLQFEETFPGTTSVVLEENYRSTKNILDVSNAIIEKNINRIEKKLFTQRDGGEKLSLFGGYDEEAEANFITTSVDALHRSGVPYREIAVLYRTNFQSRVLEEMFLYADIPYQVLGTRFFERKEVKDVLSFLRAARNPESTSDLKRIINTPPRGIGNVTLLKMISGKEHELTPAMQKRVKDFRDMLGHIATYATTHAPSETIRFVLMQSGIERHLKAGDSEDNERLLNVQELVTLATKYDPFPPEEGIERLLEDAALATDQDSLTENRDAVKLMTIHASKGLEFDYVFITGLEAGLFPQHISDDRDDEEEERRLFYVALTRARKKIFLTYASVRTIFGSKEIQIPSDFISDIPPEYLDGEVDLPSERGELLIID
jgi:DNA helicase-2/ATP-dependent DNA helicase PcrA